MRELRLHILMRAGKKAFLPENTPLAFKCRFAYPWFVSYNRNTRPFVETIRMASRLKSSLNSRRFNAFAPVATF